MTRRLEWIDCYMIIKTTLKKAEIMTANRQILTISYINQATLVIFSLHMRNSKYIFMLSEIFSFVTKPTFLKRILGNETVPLNPVQTTSTCHSQTKTYTSLTNTKTCTFQISNSKSTTATKANTPHAFSSKFHCFTVHFVSLSFIYTNVCTCF